MSGPNSMFDKVSFYITVREVDLRGCTGKAVSYHVSVPRYVIEDKIGDPVGHVFRAIDNSLARFQGVEMMKCGEVI